jgi:hypothetical protein
VGVPVLLRAVKPLYGRTRILTYFPDWSGAVRRRQLAESLVFPMLYAVLGVAVYVLDPGAISSLSTERSSLAGIAYFAIAAALILIFGPLAGIIGGSRRQASPTAT